MIRKNTTWLWIMVLGVLFTAVPVCGGEAKTLETMKEKVSYGLGVDTAIKFQRLGVDVDVDLVVKGLKDKLSEDALLVPEEELKALMMAFQHELDRRRMLAIKEVADENGKKGKAFLEKNGGNQGIISLPSGLQYRVLNKGSGEKPTEEDTVVCNYRSTLLDGTELDSTVPGEPATFSVSQVIPGWREALLLMPVGARWQLFIPPHLAYGLKGADERIGPNETLISEIELISISGE